MTGNTPVSTLPFVGPKYESLLVNLGIFTVRDLLYHLPRGYQDLSKITEIAQAPADELVVVQAEVADIKKIRIRGGKVMTKVLIQDATGTMQLTWFNQPYIADTLKRGVEYRFAGEVEEKYGNLQMTNPQHELSSKPMVHTGRLVAIYPQTAGITSKWLRARIAPLLSKVPDLVTDFLPPETRERHHLLPLEIALCKIHAPEAMAEAEEAKRRLAFDELLILQLAALERRTVFRQHQARAIEHDDTRLQQSLNSLPFTLTAAQQRTLGEILADIAQSKPMNRLLEGDVGSGKTVVAALSALVAHWSGLQTAIMAPTTVLAQQHFLTFQVLLDQLKSSSGSQNQPPTISLRTSTSKMPVADITIGTHALLTEHVTFDRLGLIIIDEQHRFGVEQRAKLMTKAQLAPHVLTMTATPIPRTMALSLYGDLDLSVIDEMPAGRLPIKTHIVPERKRQAAYGFFREAVVRGEQVYIVCPFVEDSETLSSVRSATAEFERLKGIFTTERLVLLHGRMKPADKDRILHEFTSHAHDILVTTPVVEVGLDVPDATMMVIEGAERFGLAQLHQLRGRVGRGNKQSYCFLFSDTADPRDIDRLRYLEEESSGMRLAEYDLRTRGPGEVYGVRQSGIPTLKAASFFDTEMIEVARKEAERLVATRSLTPELRLQVSAKEKLIEMN